MTRNNYYRETRAPISIFLRDGHYCDEFLMQFSLTDISDTEYTGSMESYIHALDANLHRLYPLEFENFTTSTKNTRRRIRWTFSQLPNFISYRECPLQELKVQFIHVSGEM